MNAMIYRKTLIYLIGCLLLGGCNANVKTSEEHLPKVLSEAKGDSFWRDQVQYAYAVDYAQVKDKQGVDWEVAYQDVYWGKGDRESAETVVLIHGRCANMGYFSLLTRALANEGIRVIAVDLPNYGKSLPGNLDRPVERSLQSSRESVYKLLSETLKVKQFHLFGHSMGGQWAVGYALTYAQSIKSLTLESPYGLEEYPNQFTRYSLPPLKLFDPVLSRSLASWNDVWGPLGHLKDEMSRSEREIRSMHYFKRINSETGALEKSSTGFFFALNQDSAFFTQARVQSALGNLAEYDRFITTCVRDIYAMGVETREDDPDSIAKRLGLLTIPVLMMFGEKDPFLPNTPLSGNLDLVSDVIRPTYVRLAAAGNPPLMVSYEYSGHVPHVDQPHRVSRDLIRFIRERLVNSELLNPRL